MKDNKMEFNKRKNNNRKKTVVKILSLVLVSIMALSLMAGCQKEGQPSEENLTIRIAGLKGPTSMGMVELMDLAEQGKTVNNYEFDIFASADELTPKFIQGELDIVAIPSNLASILYNSTEGDLEMLAINTLGVTYIVEIGDSIKTFEDLVGKTIYCTGKGSSPEYTLRHLLKENGIDPDKDVNLEWKSEPTEIVSLFSETGQGVAMMPQPYVTVAQSKIEGLNIAINLDKEWAKLDNGTLMITGVHVVRKDFLKEHPEKVKIFLEEYKKSTEYVNNNVEEAAKLVEKYNIVNALVAEKAIPYCNIAYIDGDEMKKAMEGYLKVLFDQNPKAVGGQLPGDDFYYEK